MQKRKEEVDVRNQGDQMVYQTEKTLNEMGDKLDAADKSEVETKLSALKQALTGTDTAAIKAATEELTQAFYKVSEKLYQAAGGAQGAGFDPESGQAARTPVQAHRAARTTTTLTTPSWMTTRSNSQAEITS